MQRSWSAVDQTLGKEPVGGPSRVGITYGLVPGPASASMPLHTINPGKRTIEVQRGNYP